MSGGTTRTELLALKAERRLARRGKELLDDKRTALLRELRNTAEEMLDEQQALDELAARARRALADAEALDGPHAVRSAAVAAPRDIAVEATPEVVMGVVIPHVEPVTVDRGRTRRGYSLLGTTPQVDAVALGFEAEVAQLLRVATREARLRRVAEEVRAVTRRVNALEHVVLPELVDRARRIARALEERERQERFRTRVVKRRLARRGGAR
jgi:V/A-type H+-transporting ATPase subunit D